MDLEGRGFTHSFQGTMNDPESVEVLKPIGDLEQLETLIRERTVYWGRGERLLARVLRHRD